MVGNVKKFKHVEYGEKRMKKDELDVKTPGTGYQPCALKTGLLLIYIGHQQWSICNCLLTDYRKGYSVQNALIVLSEQWRKMLKKGYRGAF